MVYLNTYYLFVENLEIFSYLQTLSIPGVIFTNTVKLKFLPECILIETMYEDEGIKSVIKKYIDEFKILKPLTRKIALI
jgi:hypothetical protein